MAEAPHAALADRFRADPDRARVAITVATELEDGLACSATVRGHTVTCDEPRSFGGSDSAQSPVELFLTSLATCQAITYRVWAAELGLAVDRVEVEVVGDIDLRGFLGVDGVEAAGYDGVRVRVALSGPEPAERYQELADAVDRHCPVLDVLARPIPVLRELTTEPATARR
ncbi:MAG TPA: OsmC family protein [Miltoncostaeaceae bacterium]|nr:OsmC family protein [Miltoncostaeaceae bacterium]